MSTTPTFEVKEERGRKILVITCDVTGPGELSSSGKTKIVCGTGGFTPVSGTPYKVNLNVTIPTH